MTCRCSDPVAERYGPELVCWPCFAESMGDGRIPEPEPVEAHDLFGVGELDAGPVDYMRPYRQNGSAPENGVSRLGVIDGATFALDAPSHVGAVWGRDTEVLWPEGEPLMLYGPDGVGKTTIAQQLILSRAGVGPSELLGYPVAVADRKVLYLALDRPKQAARSLRRMVDEHDRDALRNRLVVWSGSLPFDPVRQPEMLATFAHGLAAGTVVIDSTKDFGAKLSDEDTGMAISTAWKLCVEAGIEVLSLHHPRKAQGDNKKPRALADVYGSRWLTAGCGSVVLIWGDAGDPVVDLEHLKQPADVVGPLQLLHDNRAGTTTLGEDDGPDAVEIALQWVGPAPTAREVAGRLLGKPAEQVKMNEKEKARRKLEGGVRRRQLRTRKTVEDGRENTLYMASKGPHE